MAFDKLIIKSITGATKSGIKMNLAVSSLKEKLIDTTAIQIEDQLPISLPFSVRETLSEGSLPSDLLSPNTINSTPSIPEAQKPQVETLVNSIENTLNSTIQQKNTLQGGLNTITSPLTTVESLANTMDGMITGVNVAVTTIKSLPIPTSVPPGVGIPVNVINGFADSLDTLKTVSDKFEGSLEVIPGSINQINSILIPVVENLNSLDPIFDKLIKILAFIKLLSQQPVSQGDIDFTLQEITNNIQESLAVTAGPLVSNSNSNANIIANEELLNQLDENSNNPLFYKGFRLTIEFDPNNTFSFPARRVKAENDKGVKLYPIPPDQGSGNANTSSTYSFSSSTQVLVEEVKFNIDQYLLKNPQIAENIPDTPQVSAVSSASSGTSGTSGTQSTPGYVPFGEPGTASGEVRFQGGQAWRYLGGSQDKWVEHTTNLNPVGRKGVYDGEEYTLRNNPPEPFPRSTYKWSDLFYKWMYQGTQTGAV